MIQKTCQNFFKPFVTQCCHMATIAKIPKFWKIMKFFGHFSSKQPKYLKKVNEIFLASLAIIR